MLASGHCTGADMKCFCSPILAAAAALALVAALGAEAPPPSTKPVGGEGRSASMIVRMLVDLAGQPDAAESADQVLKLAEAKDASPPVKEAAAWVTANRESFVNVYKAPLKVTPWGAATFKPAAGEAPPKLYLHVFNWHASGKVIAYGLDAGNIKRAYLLRDPQKELKIEKGERDTVFDVTAKNAKSPDPVDTVVVVELAGEPKVRPLEVRQSADGSVVLHAKDAIVVGKNLRYEPEPNKNTLGYWTIPEDSAYWEFTVQKPLMFEVEMLQGCGKGSGGSEIEVLIDAMRPLTMTVQDTGHFQNFVPRVIGKVKLDAGPHKLAVKVRQKKGAAVMDLRQVTLKPA
jgi:hypothetical protein